MSGATGGATGGATVMTFTGRFRPASFRAFAEDRARLLALDSAWREAAPDRMVVAVAGQRDFIDAFEMACSLGPMDCLVHEIERRDTDSAGIATFEREHDDG